MIGQHYPSLDVEGPGLAGFLDGLAQGSADRLVEQEALAAVRHNGEKIAGSWLVISAVVGHQLSLACRVRGARAHLTNLKRCASAPYQLAPVTTAVCPLSETMPKA